MFPVNKKNSFENFCKTGIFSIMGELQLLEKDNENGDAFFVLSVILCLSEILADLKKLFCFIK